MTTHDMFDGRLQLYKRPGGQFWQSAARVGGCRFRQSTKEEHLDRARDVAEEWYLDLRGKSRNGEIIKKERTFRQAADHYLKEIRVLAISERSPKYVELLELRLNRHLLPFFGDKPLSAVNRGLVQSYRVQRAEKTIERTGQPPARSTMTQEIVHIRQVLKCAEGMGWIPFVPNLTPPYKTQGKKGRRAWFSPEEYTKLYEAARHRVAYGKRPGWKSHYEDMLDFIVIMANTGLRPDEALRLEFRDVKIEKDLATGKIILVIDVRGKVGVGYCKSMPGAVFPFQRLLKRRERELVDPAKPDAKPELPPTDRVFRGYDRAMFNKILDEEDLKFDRDGKRRTAYSLRHTYISMRLMDGADVYQVANNCRTSVKMIEDFYASHIKGRIDAGAINVTRPKTRRKVPAETKAAKTKPRKLVKPKAGSVQSEAASAA